MFTVRLTDKATAEKFRKALASALARGKMFTVRTIGEPAPAVVRRKVIGFNVTLDTVRLTVKKLYCGQHPGECVVGGPKRRASYLEWDDWIRFNGVVNDTLDAMGDVTSEAWSTPNEVCMPGQGRRFFIRKAGKRRLQWDYEEVPSRFGGQVLRQWNMGTPDQFASLAA